MRKLLGILSLSLVLLGGCGGGGGGSSSGGGGGGGTQACTATTVTLAQQLQNPVTLFPKDKNGVIVELQAVPASGAASAAGVLVFGIGTETNNTLGTATRLDGDPNTGSITAMLNGTTNNMSFMDSGSNGNFFTDSSLAVCPSPNNGFYCPASTVNETATLQGSVTGQTFTANFSVANADTLFSAGSTFTAFNNLGGPNPTANSVDLGLPFFYGQNIFTGFADASTMTAPYFAIGAGNPATAGPPNVEPLIVDVGPAALTGIATNTPFVTINICVPGTTTCQAIDHIEVDTGSIGLRLISSVLTSVKLPLTTNNGLPYAECLQFADGTSWGSLATADIVLPVSGAKATGVNVHLIGDPSVGSPPTTCTGTPENTVPTFGANGILGVGPFATDCSDGSCAPGPQGANYYSCPVTH